MVDREQECKESEHKSGIVEILLLNEEDLESMKSLSGFLQLFRELN